MNTVLDVQHEIELEATSYDGESLVASVAGLVPDSRGRLNNDGSRYAVTFFRPVMHLLIEEAPAVNANLIVGTGEGFLSVMSNTELRQQLGIDTEPLSNLTLYALVTAHEILVVLCSSVPSVERKV